MKPSMDAPAQPILPAEPQDGTMADYHIAASRSLVDRPLRILKHDDLFVVFDKGGDIPGEAGGPEGLYFRDTRFLSRMRLHVGDGAPLLLGSVVLDDNSALIVDLTNADLHDAEGRRWLPRDSVFVSRMTFLSGRRLYERLTIRRFEPLPAKLPIELRFGFDFADLFEVRGERRPQRGSIRFEATSREKLTVHYRGLDGLDRRTALRFDPAPAELTQTRARWELDFSETDSRHIDIVIACGTAEEPPANPPNAGSALRSVRRGSRRRVRSLTGIRSSNDLFNEVLSRAAADLDMLLTDTEYGLYPYAGVPWYSTVFGRDGILTALQLLWIAPDIARGVLQALALTQATEIDPAADSQPGKIIHEMRGGEMALLGEVPFRRYYGTIDATPLFVMLAGAYLRRTGDVETIRGIWPHVEAALHWIDRFGDLDGDGFVEYRRMSERGLANQGWKDSSDSVFHADGRLAEGPVALCEVQGYVYAAKREAAQMARALNLPLRGDQLDRQAEELRTQFDTRFWIEEIGCYALALDGSKEPCRVRSSNAGHALYTGIALPERAAPLARLLTGQDFFSGWGIRTIARGEARYNPMSYHNGSVWPHDNALIALGLARYGHKAEAARVMQALLDAAVYDEFRRLPELFCGFPRRRKRGPTAYPVACAPQAWAAASPFALLAAVTGIDVDHQQCRLILRNPVLPPAVDEVDLPPIRVGNSSLAVRLTRNGADVTTTVTERTGPAELAIFK